MLSEYTNPLLSSNCPDPAVTRLMDGSGYALVASSDRASRSDNSSVFPMFFSKGCQSLIRLPLTSPLLFPDLVTWKLVRHVFSPTQLPVWAVDRFYAPELHLVEGRYLLYFTAGDNQGKLRCGVALATSEDPFGDYSVLWDHYHCSARGNVELLQDIGEPLVTAEDAVAGCLDPHLFADPVSQKSYLLWKQDAPLRKETLFDVTRAEKT